MSAFTYPARLPITPLTQPPTATVTVPGSKSITNRALVLAALSSRETDCTLTGALRSEDTEVMVDCLQKLGFVVEPDLERATITVRKHGSDRLIPAESADLYVANSGTTVRFLAAMVSLSPGRYRLDGVPRMRERPIQDLLDALGQLGVRAVSETGNGCPPVVIESPGLKGGSVQVRAGVSSQFLSGLMLAAGYADAPMQVGISDEDHVVSRPYILMTRAMVSKWGRVITASGPKTEHVFSFDGVRRPPPTTYAIEPDASAASYFWGAAAITGGRVTVRGLTNQSHQGDVKLVRVLELMGCRVEEDDDGITVHGRPLNLTEYPLPRNRVCDEGLIVHGPLRGVDVDMNAISDTVMTLGAVACFADGPTTIRNVAHIRHKETDRIAALATELRKLGAGVDEFPDGLRITPRPLTGCAVDTYKDHRMAMSLALVGLRVPGVVINDPGCVAKTYPGFWQDLEKLRG